MTLVQASDDDTTTTDNVTPTECGENEPIARDNVQRPSASAVACDQRSSMKALSRAAALALIFPLASAFATQSLTYSAPNVSMFSGVAAGCPPLPKWLIAKQRVSSSVTFVRSPGAVACDSPEDECLNRVVSDVDNRCAMSLVCRVARYVNECLCGSGNGCSPQRFQLLCYFETAGPYGRQNTTSGAAPASVRPPPTSP
jgi:hypothetical protein